MKLFILIILSRSFPNLAICPPYKPSKSSIDTKYIATLVIGLLCLAVPILLCCIFVKKCVMNTDDRGIDLSSYKFITSNADNRSKDLPPSYSLVTIDSEESLPPYSSRLEINRESPPPLYSLLEINEESPNLRNEANGDYETENREQQTTTKIMVKGSVIKVYNTDGISKV